MNSEVPKNKGWTSFDDSPVHLQPSGINNLNVGHSPWGDEGWAKFQQEEVGPSTRDNAKTFVSASGASSEATQKSLTDDSTTQQNHGQPAVSLLSKNAISSIVQSSSAVNNSSSIAFAASSAISYTEGNHPLAGEAPQPEASKDFLSQHLEKMNSSYPDPWCITPQQRQYYIKQFTTMQADPKGKIDGQTARNFFTKSKLPILELSHVWELSDMDQDGHLTLEEFCTAFHLVVARKNGYELPSQLPNALAPVLIDIQLEGDLLKPKSKEQWETFSDRTSSSTTLANFDHAPESSQDIHRPAPLRMSPSQLNRPWVEQGDQHNSENIEEGSTTSTSPASRKKAPTNPYGYLKNELSEADSSDESVDKEGMSSEKGSVSGRAVRSMIHDEGHAASNSSIASSISSSVATSDRSIERLPLAQEKDSSFEQAHNDWSSRLLRPRSTSSEDTLPVSTNVSAPAPPPRPHNINKSVSLPCPKPRTTITANLSKKSTPDPDFDSCCDQSEPIAASTDQPEVGSPDVLESFADFSSLNAQNNVASNKEETNNAASSKDSKNDRKPEIKENDIHKKAPTKPPRTRITSNDGPSKPESVVVPTPDVDSPAGIAAAPKQNFSRSKSSVQMSIRELKARNTHLSRMNSDLQQQLKSVMETRIEVEMNIHQMRPFSL